MNESSWYKEQYLAWKETARSQSETIKMQSARIAELEKRIIEFEESFKTHEYSSDNDRQTVILLKEKLKSLQDDYETLKQNYLFTYQQLKDLTAKQEKMNQLASQQDINRFEMTDKIKRSIERNKKLAKSRIKRNGYIRGFIEENPQYKKLCIDKLEKLEDDEIFIAMCEYIERNIKY